MKSVIRMRWAVVLCLAGCGGAEGPPDGTGGAGAQGAGGNFHESGGAPSSGGHSGSGATDAQGGASTGGAPNACDSCSAPQGSEYESCCKADRTCGWTLGPTHPFLFKLKDSCHAFGQPGELDPSCAPLDLTVGMAGTLISKLPGCCSPDGRCGVIVHDESGCVAREDVDGTSGTCTP